jgi:hypothetical protein
VVHGAFLFAAAGFIRSPAQERIARKSYVMRRTPSPRSNVSCFTASALSEAERETAHHRRSAAAKSQMVFLRRRAGYRARFYAKQLTVMAATTVRVRFDS